MLPFSPPKIYDEIIKEVTDTLQSGWITTGPKTKQFEKNITTYCGNKRTICLNSATAGLEIMLRWFGVGKGDEVIIPAYTYCATANVVMHCGAKPIMVDVNTNDFNISVNEIKKHITKNTKVIIPVDFAGLPCDYSLINELVNLKEYKSIFSASNDVQKKLGRILVLADAAHSFGAEYKGMKSGSLTDISVFSFHAVKNLTTAEGGAVALNLPEVFDNDKIYQELCVKTLHGQSKDALAKTVKGAWQYDVVEPGYKANMTDIQASLGIVELKYYEKETLVKRKEIFDLYTKLLQQYSWAELPLYHTVHKKSSFHIYPLRIKGINEQERNNIIQEVFNQDIAVNVHFQPLPMLSYYKNMGYNIEDYPIAFDNYSREISLPVYFNLSLNDVKKVVNALVKAVNKVVGG